MILKFLLSLGFCFRKKQKLSYSVFLILILLQFPGCYSYRTISHEEYIKQKKHGSVKLFLKNGREVLVEKPEDILMFPDNEKIILKNNVTDSVICFDDILKIKEEKFDVILTCFSSVWLSAIGIVVFLGIVALTFTLIYGPLKLS